MNNKRILLLIICFASLLVIGSASAANLNVRDFDDYFVMNTPKDVSFEKDDQSADNELDDIMVSYLSDDLAVMYFDSPTLSQSSRVAFIQQMFESAYPDLDECYEIQDGNIVMLKPKTMDEEHAAIIAVSSGNKTVLLAGTDFNMLREMAYSVKFK